MVRRTIRSRLRFTDAVHTLRRIRSFVARRLAEHEIIVPITLTPGSSFDERQLRDMEKEKKWVARGISRDRGTATVRRDYVSPPRPQCEKPDGIGKTVCSISHGRVRARDDDFSSLASRAHSLAAPRGQPPVIARFENIYEIMEEHRRERIKRGGNPGDLPAVRGITVQTWNFSRFGRKTFPRKRLAHFSGRSSRFLPPKQRFARIRRRSSECANARSHLIFQEHPAQTARIAFASMGNKVVAR